MAITSAEIHNQSFSIDRKGYDVDEVDVFLEHVADEIDALNAQIADLQNQLNDSKFDGFDTPAAPVAEVPAQPAPAPAPADESAELADARARISELEYQLEEKTADGNAIAQALIIAQRSADEILAKANATAAETIQDAKDEAQRIIDRANGDKQDVLDAIRKLEDDREDAREEYQELLTDFINDASRKLAEIGGAAQIQPAQTSYYNNAPAAETGRVQAPVNAEGVAYSTPQNGGVVAAAATPVPASMDKDLSGFGDADDDFAFDELD